ncbi:MAG: AgmX/PglI C-terminal domain-containing protein, partial [Polyangiaceae bacterium]
MRRSVACLAGLVTLLSPAGCKKRVAPPSDLPLGAPRVAVRGETIDLDGKPAGTLRDVLELDRIIRRDELFSMLKDRREAWKTAHPGAPFPGEVVIELPRGTKLVAAKSVFQTAAFAGYPFETLLVDDGTPSRWVGHLEAVVPHLPDPSRDSTPAPLLSVTLRADAIALSWTKGGGALPDEQVVPGAPALHDALAAMVARDAVHTAPSDAALDPAVIYAPNDADVGALIPVVDALDGVRRDVDAVDGGRRSASAFALAFSVLPAPAAPAPPPASGLWLFGGLGGLGGHGDPARSVLRVADVSVSGRLPPEVVQRIVRANFGRFRLCYEQALTAKPALAGDVKTRVIIDAGGEVSTVAGVSSTLSDPAAIACIQRAFQRLSFPQPEGGIV